MVHGLRSDGDRRLQSGRQGAACETPHHTIRSRRQVKLVTEYTDGLNSDQAVCFIEIFTQLHPSSPLFHASCKKSCASPLNTAFPDLLTPSPLSRLKKRPMVCVGRPWYGRVQRY